VGPRESPSKTILYVCIEQSDLQTCRCGLFVGFSSIVWEWSNNISIEIGDVYEIEIVLLIFNSLYF